MNCRCVSARLSAYLDGELSGREMLSVRRHLGECEACSREFSELQALKRLIGSLDAPEVREGFEEALVLKVLGASERKEERPRLWRLALVSSLAAACVVFAGLQWIAREQSSPAQPVASSSFSLERDQAYLAGGDPLSGRAPIITVSDASR